MLKKSALLLLLALLMPFPATAAMFETGGIALEYSGAAPLGIIAVRSSADGPALFVDEATVETTWELVMSGPDGVEVRLDPVSANLGGHVDVTADRLTMVWDAAEVPGGTVKVSCTFEAATDALADQCKLTRAARKYPLLYGNISVANESGCDLREVQFPRLTLLAAPGPAEETTLVFPRAYGRSWRNPFDAPRGYLVGTMEPAGLRGDAEMQFGTLYDDAGNGLYWAAYDGAGYHKRMVYDNKTPSDQIKFKHCYMPGNCTTPGVDFASPYPVVLGAYEGDWWDASRMYREWALQQKWCSKGPWKDRADVPAWLKECDIWVRGDAKRTSAEFERDFVQAFQDEVGGVIGVQLYGWYQPEPGKPDWSATLGWPMVEGYPDMIAEAKARGIYHTPYVNSLQTSVADVNCPPGLEPAFLLGADLQPARWTSEGDRYVMCAATDTWRDILVRGCERLVSEGNVSGIYLDQLGGHCGRPCYSPDHGHPVGGGHYATDGLREICAAVREAMWKHDPAAALSGEVQHETLLDVTDHRLMHYNYWPGWVNLWAAVYGDMTSTYGRTLGFIRSLDAEGNPRPDIDFYGPMANTFVSGMSFGRFWPTGNPQNLISSPGNEEFARFFKECLGLRRAGRSWMEFGYLQRPVKFAAAIPGVPIKDPKGRDSSMRAVLSSAWINSDEELAFVFANVSEDEQRFSWSADMTRYEIPGAEVYVVSRVLPDGTLREIASLEKMMVAREETMPPHSVLFYRVTVGAY